MTIVITMDKEKLAGVLGQQGTPKEFRISHDGFGLFCMVFPSHFEPATNPVLFTQCAGHMFGKKVLWDDGLSPNELILSYPDETKQVRGEERFEQKLKKQNLSKELVDLIESPKFSEICLGGEKAWTKLLKERYFEENFDPVTKYAFVKRGILGEIKNKVVSCDSWVYKGEVKDIPESSVFFLGGGKTVSKVIDL